MKKVFTVLFLIIFVSWVKAETLSLEKCIELGKKNNPDFRISKYQMNKAKNSYLNSYSPFIPTFGTGVEREARTTKTDVDPQTGYSLGEVSSETTTSFSGYFYSRMTLFSLPDYFNTRASKAYYKSLKYAHDQQMLDMELVIKSKYYNVLTYKKLLDASIESINRARKQLEKIDQMYQLGLKAKLDVVKQKGLLGQALLDSISYTKSHLSSKGELNEAIGYSPDNEIEIVDILDSNFIEIDYNTMIHFAKEKHPLLKNYKSNLSYQKNSLIGNWTSYFPTVSLNFSRSFGGKEFSDVTNNYTDRYSQRVTLTFGWTIFDGFNREFRLKNQKLNYNIAKENLKKTELSLVQDIKSSFLSAMEAKEKIRVNRINYESALQEYELAQEKYNLGSGSYLDLLDAQVSLRNTQGQLISSLYEYKIFLAQLENKTSYRFEQ